MKTIYKYTANIKDGPLTIVMPASSQILTVQMQHGKPYIWALVDTDLMDCERHFIWHGTGHDVSHPSPRHVGTVQLDGGALVFHLFEVTP